MLPRVASRISQNLGWSITMPRLTAATRPHLADHAWHAHTDVRPAPPLGFHAMWETSLPLAMSQTRTRSSSRVQSLLPQSALWLDTTPQAKLLPRHLETRRLSPGKTSRARTFPRVPCSLVRTFPLVTSHRRMAPSFPPVASVFLSRWI